MLERLVVPDELQRNSPQVAADGIEETGARLIELATQRAGLATLADSDVLDVGCGVRFTQAILHRKIPIGSYTGLEVCQPVVDFLKREVEPADPRFRFAHWDLEHGLYNPRGRLALADQHALPVPGAFDQIWLFSVLTHLDLAGSRALLALLRTVIRPTGTLVFTAFVLPEPEGVRLSAAGHPLARVDYGKRTVEGLIAQAGWNLQAFYPSGGRPYLQPCFVCRPAPLERPGK